MDVAYVQEIAPKQTKELPYYRDVILRVSFQNTPVVESLGSLALLPDGKCSPLLFARLVRSIIRDVGIGTT